MNRLIAFGDSWTAGHGVDDYIQYKEIATPQDDNRFISKLRNSNGWPRWVADKLQYPFVNYGECGVGNDYIFQSVVDLLNTNLVRKTDLIIVVFSYPYRQKTNPIDIFKKIESVLEPYNHFYFNGFYPMFKEEQFDTSTLPEYFINPDSSLADILKKYEIENNQGVWEYDSRSVWNDEKNYFEGDYHPNLLGYKIIAEHIYQKINKL